MGHSTARAHYGYSSRTFRLYPHYSDRKWTAVSIAGRALVEGRIVQIPDVKADPEYTFSPALRFR